MFRALILIVFLISWFTAAVAQQEQLDNLTIIEMSKAGLGSDLIIRKISVSRTTFDVTAKGLIDLKKAGVDDTVIGAMVERTETPDAPTLTATTGFSESGQTPIISPDAIIGSAKTIAFGKSSLQPSRQALEKELMKRPDFQQLELTIERYKETSDLFVDIGFVSGSWLTHRYVYRIYDRKSGAVLAAGETTSWGSLPHNLARHITKSLASLRTSKT